MNKGDENRGSSGLSILWPDTNNEEFIEQLEKAKKGDNANNISPIIKYSLENGVVALWFGDLETDFMDSITNEVSLPKADIVFAPHHGRSSGKLPSNWLETIEPQIIVIGNADSANLEYYKGYNTITQNSAGDVVFECETGKVHVYVSRSHYSVKYLDDEGIGHEWNKYYIGSFRTRSHG